MQIFLQGNLKINIQKINNIFNEIIELSVLPNTLAKFCIRFQNIDQQIFINIYDDIPHVFDELNLKIDSKSNYIQFFIN